MFTFLKRAFRRLALGSASRIFAECEKESQQAAKGLYRTSNPKPWSRAQLSLRTFRLSAREFSPTKATRNGELDPETVLRHLLVGRARSGSLGGRVLPAFQ
jgi:hypothetical protein